MPTWIDEEGGKHEYNPPAPEMPQALSTVFRTPKKTLKLETLDNTTLEEAVRVAYLSIMNENSNYNRIEFKYKRCYVVVAKLKD